MAKALLIALDDGHGMATSGKRTPILPIGTKSETETFMHENEFNRRVVEILNDELKRCGFRTVLTSPTDADVPLAERVRITNRSEANMLLSVHANALKGTWGSWGGIETYCYFGSAFSKRAGEIIHKHLMDGTQLRDRGLKEGGWLYLIRNTNAGITAILVECGFMDNLYEAKLLLSEEYRQECAIELAKGVCEIYKYKYVPRPEPKPKLKGLYKVQVGAFSELDNANHLVEDLENKGFNGYIKYEEV